MTVPTELQDKWKGLYSVGDFEAIAKASGLSPETIRNGFNKGECTYKVFQAIASFYKERNEEVGHHLDH